MQETPDKHKQSKVLETIRKRYSCRRYRIDPVSPDQVALLEEAIRWAPSACNRQPYTFHFITDRKTIGQIARAVPVGPVSVNSWIETAPLIVAAAGFRELIWHQMAQVVDTDYHRADAVIAMDHLSLVATDIGLGTCWVGWFNRKKVGNILGISSKKEVVILMTVGHPDQDPPKERRRKDPGELFVQR